jgi:hypothetical protein
MSGRKLFLPIAGLGLLIVVAACSGGPGVAGPGSTSTAAPTTQLIIEITGGFAYVPDVPKRTLEIAYLNDVELKDATGKVICAVDEIGTDLIVLRGKIVSPASPPPNRTFDLDGIVVTIPALDNTTTPLTHNRPIGHPNPAKPANTSQWANLQYVPSLKDFHPNTGIRPTWRSEVNGRVVLKGGNVVATVPTDPAIEKADFEFKKGATSFGSFAVTDKIIYTVDVPGTAVELILTRAVGATVGSTTLRIEPPAPGKPVKLKLHGLHGADGISSFTQGQEVPDFCAFYSLLEPKQSDMVKMFYNGPPVTVGPAGQPSPGYFCPGDGF